MTMQSFLDRIRNWRTTGVSVIAGVILILTNIGYAVDTNPDTVMDSDLIVTTVVAIGAMLALLFAKD